MMIMKFTLYLSVISRKHAIQFERLKGAGHYTERLLVPSFLLYLAYHCVLPSNLHAIAEVENTVMKFINDKHMHVSVFSIRSTPGYSQFLNDLKAIGKPPNIQFADVANRAPNGSAASEQFASYQLMFIFRINLARAILYENISFWSTQSDSIWRANLFDLGFDYDNGEFDLYFDEVGNDELYYFRKMKGWICGSTFFARANDRTRRFFDRVYYLLLHMLVPDSAIMAKLCQNGDARCYLLPHRIATSSNWLLEYKRENPPLFLQFDVVGENRNKMNALRKAGFGFIDERTKRCSIEAVNKGISILANHPKTIMPEHRSLVNWTSDDIYLRLIPFGVQRFQRIRFLTAFRSRYGYRFP